MYYRPPSSTTEDLENLQRDFDRIKSEKEITETILAGDFNVPHINWKTNTILENPQYGIEIKENVMDIVNNHSLTQVVQEPTCGKNTLDLIFTTSPDLMDEIQTTPGKRNHHAVTALYRSKLDINKKPKCTVYMYGKADNTAIEKELTDFKELYLKEANEKPVNENWEQFKKKIASIILKNVPKKTVGTKRDLPYITKKIKKMMKLRKRRWNRAKKTKKAEDRCKFDEIQSAIESQLEQEYHNYLESLFDNSGNSTKNLWSFIKSKRQDQIGIPTLKYQNKLLTTATAKAEAFADQYESVFTEEDTEKIPDKGYLTS